MSSDSFVCNFTGLPYVDVGIAHEDDDAASGIRKCSACVAANGGRCDVYKERQERIDKARAVYKRQAERLDTIRESLEDFIATQDEGGEEYKLFFDGAFAKPARKAPNTVFTRSGIVKTIGKNRRRYYHLKSQRALKILETIKQLSSQNGACPAAPSPVEQQHAARFNDILRAARELETE